MPPNQQPPQKSEQARNPGDIVYWEGSGPGEWQKASDLLDSVTKHRSLPAGCDWSETRYEGRIDPASDRVTHRYFRVVYGHHWGESRQCKA